MSSGYKIFTSKDNSDYFDAVLKHQFSPTDETKKLVEKLSLEISEKAKQSQIKTEGVFAGLYGVDTLHFVKSISKDNFLVGKSYPYHLSWAVKEDLENDNYWSVSFYKGVFNYVMECCGGYGGTEMIEENISNERVLQLINNA